MKSSNYKIPGIYSILCSANQKFYIGSSVNIHVRWTRHKRELRNGTHSNPHLQNAYNKYHEKAFVCVVVEACDKEQLQQREQFYLDKLQPFNSIGFNLNQHVARGRLGRKLSPESIKKRSQTRIDKGCNHCSVETRKRMSEAKKGIVFSKKHLENLKKARAHLKKPLSDDHKRKISNSLKGRKKPVRSAEHKLKISRANKGRKMPPRTKQHLANLAASRKANARRMKVAAAINKL